jgi:hypothetical protein
MLDQCLLSPRLQKMSRHMSQIDSSQRFNQIPVSVSFHMRKLHWRLEHRNNNDYIVPGNPLGEDETNEYKRFDAREVREAFLKIATRNEALRFFRTFHCAWENERGNLARIGMHTVSQVIAITKRLLRLPPGANMYVLSEDFPRYLELQLRTQRGFFLDVLKKVPQLVMTFSEPTDLITGFGVLAAVERAIGAQYRVCARPDCKEIFRVDTKRPKIYHDPYCGHLVAVRKNRGSE